MSCIRRPLRHPFILSDTPNHKQYKVTALSWLGAFPFWSLVTILLRFRKLSSVWNKWAAAGQSPQGEWTEHPSSPLPSSQLAPSACLCPSRPDHWSFVQKQEEASWAVPIFPLSAWGSYVTEELNASSTTRAYLKRINPFSQMQQTIKSTQVWDPKLEFSYRKVNGTTWFMLPQTWIMIEQGVSTPSTGRSVVETVSEWGWGGSGKARG